MDTVRCSDCGFLQQMKNPFIVAEHRVSADRETRSEKASKHLKCFKQEPTFKDRSHISDRDCEQFVKWEPGYSPWEHAMLGDIHRREGSMDEVFVGGTFNLDARQGLQNRGRCWSRLDLYMVRCSSTHARLRLEDIAERYSRLGEEVGAWLDEGVYARLGKEIDQAVELVRDGFGQDFRDPR